MNSKHHIQLVRKQFEKTIEQFEQFDYNQVDSQNQNQLKKEITEFITLLREVLQSINKNRVIQPSFKPTNK